MIIVCNFSQVLFDSRCTFGSEACRNGTIQPTLTDLGVCYTFNNDPKNQLVSNASGSCLLIGLTLTLTLNSKSQN